MLIPDGTKFVDSDGFEICILCREKAEPPVLFRTSVDARTGYIEGCGQTCVNTKLCQERQRTKRTKEQGSF